MTHHQTEQGARGFAVLDQAHGRHPPNSPTRRYFENALGEGWLDAEGWVTRAGRQALREWDAEPE